MSSSILFLSNTSLTITKPISSTSFPLHLYSTPQCISFNKRNTSLPISVTTPSISNPQPQPPFNVEYLESEFGSHGVYFKELGPTYVIKMVLENGSAASLLMPSGLITSYKPKMWHGSTIEVLQTSVVEGQTNDGDIGGLMIQGGVSLALNCVDDDRFSWSPTSWVLNDVKGSPQESIQVEIISRDSDNLVEVKYNIVLKEDTLKSEISVSNSRTSQFELTGCVLSHLNVSTPDATYAFGLERSNFFDRQPLNSNFCIIPPKIKNKDAAPSQLWPLPSLNELFSDNRDERESEEEAEGEETENYKHLTGKMSRIYTSAPRNFTIIDRGRRNSVMVGRKGFEELYIYSPGSSHESYGKYSYICVGQTALLKPIMLGPKQQWRGEQQLHNPNM